MERGYWLPLWPSLPFHWQWPHYLWVFSDTIPAGRRRKASLLQNRGRNLGSPCELHRHRGEKEAAGCRGGEGRDCYWLAGLKVPSSYMVFSDNTQQGWVAPCYTSLEASLGSPLPLLTCRSGTAAFLWCLATEEQLSRCFLSSYVVPFPVFWLKRAGFVGLLLVLLASSAPGQGYTKQRESSGAPRVSPLGPISLVNLILY